MRKVRDYDAELKALGDKARALKAKKVQQLGELVTSTGADALDPDMLAGVLLAAVGSANAEEKEAWRSRGAAFFQGRGRKAWRRTGCDGEGRSEEHTSELQSLMRISYAVFCLQTIKQCEYSSHIRTRRTTITHTNKM